MKHASDFDGPTAESIPCDSARLQAAAWIDGESQASNALGLHLERCGECRSFVDELRALSARLAPLRSGGPVADLWPKIAARARASSRAKAPRNQRVLRIAAALIGCAATAALLEAATLLERAPRNVAQANSENWPAALHPESAGVRELKSVPEHRLLASIDPTQGHR